MERMRRYRGSTITLLLLIALVLCGWWIENIKTIGHLKTPWIVVMAVLVIVCAFAGHLVNGRIDGILIDDRNRISLSRFQWVIWLIIVSGGYFTMAVWDVANGFDVPRLDEQTLILLGIVSGSAVVSTVLVNNKKAQTDAPKVPPAVNDTAALQSGAADVNVTVQEASWSDLFMGEDAANRYVVDISRLQKLIFTVILALAYLAWLWVIFSKDKPLAMPMIGPDSNFNWLLGISHLAYQGAKAVPKTPAVGAVPPVQPAPQPAPQPKPQPAPQLAG
jgi:hypothetical protein